MKNFTYHDAPRRAHSIAAQGGVNSARGKKMDNDGAYRHTKDTVKGGDYRCRESDCWRLANESVRVIDHMNAIGAPFAREYGGTLATRSFGGVQVSRTYYTRGQTGQQLQLATTSALYRQIGAGNVEIFTHSDLVDLIVDKGVCQGIITRNLITGELTYADDGYDLLSKIVVTVLDRGGDVLAVRADEIDHPIWNGQALAGLRYPLT